MPARRQGRKTQPQRETLSREAAEKQSPAPERETGEVVKPAEEELDTQQPEKRPKDLVLPEVETFPEIQDENISPDAPIKVHKAFKQPSPKKGKDDEVREELRQLARSFENEQNKLLSKTMELPNIPLRLKTWQKSKCIKLSANYYQLNFEESDDIFFYNVTVTHLPTKTARLIFLSDQREKKQVVRQSLRIPRNSDLSYVYGGGINLYTNWDILPADKKFLKTVTKGQRKFSVAAVSEKEKNENKLQMIMMKDNLNYDSKISENVLTYIKTCLWHKALENNLTIVNNYVYDVKGEIIEKGDEGSEEERGVQVRFCCSHDIILTSQGITIVLDIYTSFFHIGQKILDFASDVLKKQIESELSDKEWEALSSAIDKVGLKVMSEQLEGVFVVKGLMKSNAKETILDIGDKQTVDEYFQEKFKVTLHYPNLPCLQLEAPKTKKEFVRFVPLEVCYISPGVQMKKVDKDLAKLTNIKSENRFALISQYAELISENTVNNIGLKLEPIKLTGIVLKSPFIQYSSESGVVSTAPHENGWWSFTENKKLLQGVNVQNWMIVSFAEEEECSKEMLEVFATELQKTAQKIGLKITKPQDVRILKDKDTLKMLEDVKDVDLLVAVLTSRKDDRYIELKYNADINFKLVTQCVDSSKIAEREEKGKKPSYVLTLCQKINAKMGGINHAIYSEDSIFSDSASIVFGARTAPPPVSCQGSVIFSSLAAVVGSLDTHPFRYAACCRLQVKQKKKMKWRSQIIFELKVMVQNILKQFCDKMKSKPKKIIFFRYGVIETHFQKVLNFEHPLIKEACKEIDSTYCPSLTYIMVQKKNRTWLTPEDPEYQMKVPSGTVVDEGITSPTPLYNYYLFSQESSDITGRVTHYTLLYDESCFKKRELQRITYHLCHTYARCTCSISVPAPIKYASLIAKRIKNYIDLQLREHRERTESYDPEIATGKVIKFMKTADYVKNMFYV